MYEAPVASLQSGAYAVRVTQTKPGSTALGRTLGLVAPTPAEYRLLGANEPLLGAIRAATGGEKVDEPAAVWVHDLRTTSRYTDLWPWLLVLALLLWPLDIALRRVSLGRRELADGRRWISDRTSRRRVAARTQTSESMLAARERAGSAGARSAILREAAARDEALATAAAAATGGEAGPDAAGRPDGDRSPPARRPAPDRDRRRRLRRGRDRRGAHDATAPARRSAARAGGRARRHARAPAGGQAPHPLLAAPAPAAAGSAARARQATARRGGAAQRLRQSGGRAEGTVVDPAPWRAGSRHATRFVAAATAHRPRRSRGPARRHRRRPATAVATRSDRSVGCDGRAPGPVRSPGPAEGAQRLAAAPRRTGPPRAPRPTRAAATASHAPARHRPTRPTTPTRSSRTPTPDETSLDRRVHADGRRAASSGQFVPSRRRRPRTSSDRHGRRRRAAPRLVARPASWGPPATSVRGISATTDETGVYGSRRVDTTVLGRRRGSTPSAGPAWTGSAARRHRVRLLGRLRRRRGPPARPPTRPRRHGRYGCDGATPGSRRPLGTDGVASTPRCPSRRRRVALVRRRAGPGSAASRSRRQPARRRDDPQARRSRAPTAASDVLAALRDRRDRPLLPWTSASTGACHDSDRGDEPGKTVYVGYMLVQ